MKIRVRVPGPDGALTDGVVEQGPATGPILRDLGDIVERVLLVPSSLRQFGVAPELAERVCGVGPELLQELLDLGFPSREIDGQRTFDGVDLANVAVHRGLASMQRHAIVSWGRTLEAASRHPFVRFTLEYRPYCRRCQSEAGGSYVYMVPPGREVAARGDGRHRVTVERPTAWPAPPAEAAAIAEHLAEFWFWGIHHPLIHDRGFMRENRLADCRMAAWVTEEECRARGLEVRFRFGLMVTVPFSGGHYWNELRVGDEWVPFDPFLVQIITRHGELDERRWPAMRSPGTIFASFGTDRPCDLTAHNGHATPPSIATTIQAGAP